MTYFTKTSTEPPETDHKEEDCWYCCDYVGVAPECRKHNPDGFEE